MNLKDLAADHPYYSSDSNYYRSDCNYICANFKDFLIEWEDADLDLNHLFRFDIKLHDDEDESKGYYGKFFFILQRKGVYTPCHVEKIEEDDVDSLKGFLEKHWEHTKLMWEPISSK